MASLPPPGADDALYLLDIAGWIHRSFHAVPAMTTRSGEPVNAVSGVAGMLVRLLVDRRPGYLGVAADAPGPGFRHAIFPAYKAARLPRDPDLVVQYERVRQIVAAHRIPILEAPGFEADDVIAAAARHGRAAGLRVVIIAHDKDLSQLVGDGVVMWDGRDRVTGPEEVRARWGVGPEKLGDLLALAGDATDGIPGVPGIGAKTAADLLARRGTLEQVLLRGGWETSPTLRAKLQRHAEEARMSRRLVGLRDDAPIVFDLAALRVGWGDPAPIQTIYAEVGFTRLAAEVERMDKAPPAHVAGQVLLDDAPEADELVRPVALDQAPPAEELVRHTVVFEWTEQPSLRDPASAPLVDDAAHSDAGLMPAAPAGQLSLFDP